MRWLLLVVLWWDPLCCLILNHLLGRVPGPTVMHLARVAFLVEQPLDWALFLGLLVFLVQFFRLRRPALVGR